jgi:Zn-dependent protease
MVVPNVPDPKRWHTGCSGTLEMQAVGSASGIAVRGADTPGPNSGQPPKPLAPVIQAVREPRFYRIDSRAVTLREYAWGHPAAVLVGAVTRLLRLRLPSSTDDPCVEWLAPFEIDEAALEGEARGKLQPLVEELQALGFHSAIHHLVEDDLHHTDTWLVTLAHESGRAWARIHIRRWTFTAPHKERLFTEIVTPFANGRFLWTLSSKPDMQAPPACQLLRKAGARPSELWSLHQAALQKAAGRAITPVGTADAVRQSLERHHAAVRGFHVRRGVFVPATARERAEVARCAASRKAAHANGSRHPRVIAEMERLASEPQGGKHALLLLIVSAALFVGAFASGSAPFSASYLAILVPVLLFHEAGHWLAMRAFGYRNLKMFFIPFFGAAVTGRHYNVPGWKKAVVSLMGPLPGILLGAILGTLGLLLAKPLLVQIALVALVLNAINLLPILPLDGGWVVQAILASRSVLFEVAFRGLAVAALVAGGFLLNDVVLKVLGFAMLASLPMATKLARITGELRRAELAGATSQDDAIPPATAAAIADRVAGAFTKRVSTKQLAQLSLNVFEALNARPPRLLASLSLGAVQLFGLVGAAVFTMAMAVGQGGGLAGLASAAALPATELDPDAMAEWRGERSESLLGAPHNVIVASFGSAAEAERTARETQQQARTRAATATFGHSVLLALPATDDAARQQWLAAFQGKAKDVFVATPSTPAHVQISCEAGSEPAAAAIEQEARDYFQAPRMNLVPPWIDRDTRTEEERLAHARARRTYARLAMWPIEVFQDPKLAALTQKQQAAVKAGDTARIRQLAGEQQQLLLELRRAHLARVTASPNDDPRVAEAYRELVLEAPAARSEAELDEELEGLGGGGPIDAAQTARIAPLLGQLPVSGKAAHPSDHPLSATGVLARTEKLVSLPFVRFGSSFAGPPALVRWLRAKGCAGFRYQLSASLASEESD